jgi:predicted transcriptional regulator
MSKRNRSQVVVAGDNAIAAEIRVIFARRNIRQEDIWPQLGVSQSWLSRRLSGEVPMTTAELTRIMNVIDEDITRVIAAGTAAMIEAATATNPCLSYSEYGSAQRISGWARRGYELATWLQITNHTVDTSVKVA